MIVLRHFGVEHIAIFEIFLKKAEKIGMTAFEIYNLFLCIFVFIGFTALFGVMLFVIMKSTLKLINAGVNDDKIKTEYEKAIKHKKSGVVDMIISILLCAIVFAIFSFSMIASFMPDKVSGNIPTARVVNSGSMSTKNEKNKYLFENNINNQLQTFDLIFTYKLPKEEDIKLYDIIVYEVDGVLVMHRVVGIEAPNADHPDNYWFLLQGDAVPNPDRFPVLYSQMKAICRGGRIPFIGSFVAFMQSPAGWLCIILLVVGVIVAPILEKKVFIAMKKRLTEIGYIGGHKTLENTLFYTAPAENKFDKFSKNKKSFSEKLDDLGYESSIRYADIINYVSAFKELKASDSGNIKSFKFKNKSLIKIAIKGKTINVYLALNPADYQNTKYKFIDVSAVKKYSSTPMRIKLTSDRQVKYVKELIKVLLNGQNIGGLK